jgi:hypothetical protein
MNTPCVEDNKRLCVHGDFDNKVGGLKMSRWFGLDNGLGSLLYCFYLGLLGSAGMYLGCVGRCLLSGK